MGLGPRLDLQTSQTLTLSPQLQAAIKLLALGNLELAAEIAAELDRNPLLEIEGEGDGDAFGSEPTADGEAPATQSSDAADMDLELAAGGGAASDADQDVDMGEERFHHDCASDSNRTAGSDEDFSFDSFAAGTPSLSEVLERQAMALGGADLAIAMHLVSLIDPAGYLTDPVAEIAARLGVAETEVERVLAIVQSFEPTGVGARNLAECIALQAKEADRYDPCMAALIDNLDLVVRGDLVKLRRLCDVDAEELADMLRELRSYDPKPGLVYGGGEAVPIVPDVFVRRVARGWAVELNNATLPRLVVNRRYHARIAAHSASAENVRGKAERQFLDGCLAQANWLMKALDQRASTILKVSTALVEEQRAFFEHGVARLKPLTLRRIADMIGMHELTVSRVTSNKYLSCERGVFELKYFFTTAIHAADGGDDASAEAARQMLKALIEAEAPLKPLSDDRLVEMLRAEGYDLARRTVAKYREAIGIPSSFDRRRRALVNAA